jgi:thiol-disulfide isomerase/thioredoxin
MVHQRNVTKIVLAMILGLVLLLAGCQTSPTGSQVGSFAPDFTLPDLNGQMVSLSSLRGKPVLLNFWATWCPPCRQEMPYLQQINTEWAPKGLVLLAVDIGESSAQAKAFLENNGLSLPVVLDSDGTVSDGLYNITAIPTTFFIDSSGIIQQKVIGAFPSKSAIEKYVSQIVP